MAFSLPVILLVGAGLRIWLFRSPGLAHWLSERPELVTPLTSWKRVTEGLALRRAGMSPYDGDVYHETPLMLRVVEFADDLLGQTNMWVLLLVIDLMTALVLSYVAVEIRQYLLERQAAEEERYAIKITVILKTLWNCPKLSGTTWTLSGHRLEPSTTVGIADLLVGFYEENLRRLW